MQRALSGLGVIGLCVVCGCSQDPGAGSQVGQSMGGGGNGGAAGSLVLGISGAGAGGGGAGGASGGGAGGSSANNGGNVSGGAGGNLSSGGSTSGGSGMGGSKPAGMCTRAPASDADCTDFFEMPSQAYACDDTSAYFALNGMHGNKCGNGNLVPGAKVGACCPP